MDDPLPISQDHLERRERASYTVLLAGVAAMAGFLALDFGVLSFVQDDDASLLLAVAAVPYAVAALATWLCRRSWEATSWLFGTWVFMTGAAVLFLLRYTVLETRSGFLSELIYLGPPLGQAPVVLFAAAVAFVLHRRDAQPL